MEHNCFCRNRLLLLAVVAALVVAAHPCWGAPEPALVPPPGTWQLEFELHGEPQQICIALPGDEQPQRFWYLLYTVTNNTGEDVEFYPQFYLFTDTLKLYQAGVKVRRPVFEAIRDQYADTIPLLEAESMVTGRILIGKDNARDSVAVFEDFDPNATWAKVLVAGLSNETVIVEHPVDKDPETGRAKEVLLRKTLMLEYQIPGDRYHPEDRVMLYRNRDWIMR